MLKIQLHPKGYICQDCQKHQILQIHHNDNYNILCPLCDMEELEDTLYEATIKGPNAPLNEPLPY